MKEAAQGHQQSQRQHCLENKILKDIRELKFHIKEKMGDLTSLMEDDGQWFASSTVLVLTKNKSLNSSLKIWDAIQGTIQ